MKPIIKKLAQKQLIGQSVQMSLANNKTGQLWQAFGPRIKEIPNRVSTDKISMQVYPPLYYEQFSPIKAFEKWATVEVSTLNNIPAGMQTFVLEEGLYAVFNYKGSSSDPSIFRYIFSEWIPHSEYEVDDRPHFEVLGTKYQNNSPDSEEEIWIPIRKK
jgi:AraC family transcriptional regulator